MSDPLPPNRSIPNTSNPSPANSTPPVATSVPVSTPTAAQSTASGQANNPEAGKLAQVEHNSVTLVVNGIKRQGPTLHKQMLAQSDLKNSLTAALRVLANENLDESRMNYFAAMFLNQADDFHQQHRNYSPFNGQKPIAAAHTYAKLYKADSEWAEVASSLEKKLGNSQTQIWRILLNVESTDPYTAFTQLVSKVNDPEQIAFINKQINSLRDVPNKEARGELREAALDQQQKIVRSEIEDLFTLFSNNLEPDEFEKVFSAAVELNQPTAFINKQIAIVSELPKDIRKNYCWLLEITSKDHLSRLDEVPKDLAKFGNDNQKGLYLSGLRGIFIASPREDDYLRRKKQLIDFVKKYPNLRSSHYVTDFFAIEHTDEQFQKFQNLCDLYIKENPDEEASYEFLPFKAELEKPKPI